MNTSNVPTNNYASLLDTTNDFTKFTDQDFNNTLNINIQDLKNECIEFNSKQTSIQSQLKDLSISKSKKLFDLKTEYDEQVLNIENDYNNDYNLINTSNDETSYGNRKSVLKYIDDYTKFCYDTDKLLKSFDTCRTALKNDQMNDNFIAQLQTEKMDTFMEKSLFVKGLRFYLKKNDIPLEFNHSIYNLKYLHNNELNYAIPSNMRPYESFVQYDDVHNKSNDKDKNEMFLKFSKSDLNIDDYKNKSFPDSSLLSTNNVNYKTPYYDINTTYQPIIVPDNVDEHIVQSRGSLLEDGTNRRPSSTDYWLLQTALIKDVIHN